MIYNGIGQTEQSRCHLEFYKLIDVRDRSGQAHQIARTQKGAMEKAWQVLDSLIN